MTEKLMLAGVHVPTIEEVLALGKYDMVRVKSFYWDCPLCEKQLWGHSWVEKKMIRLSEANDPLYEQHEHEAFASALKAEIEDHLESHEEVPVVQ